MSETPENVTVQEYLYGSVEGLTMVLASLFAQVLTNDPISAKRMMERVIAEVDDARNAWITASRDQAVVAELVD